MRVNVTVTTQGFDVAADLERIKALVETLPNDLAQVAADVGADAVLSAAAEVRGSLSMSNNKQARSLDALPIVRQGTATGGGGKVHAETEIVGTPRGVWHLIEYGSLGEYRITPKKGPGGRRGPRRALNVPPYGQFAAVTHPAQRGTSAWSVGMENAEPAIMEAIETAFTVAVQPEGTAV